MAKSVNSSHSVINYCSDINVINLFNTVNPQVIVRAQEPTFLT